ncbi:MAG: bifunctional phosphoribosyl-AMP cyclohydrolase/phosphoribosyl-ATP diphosphatase HisIE [Acidobacteriota bacterium]
MVIASIDLSQGKAVQLRQGKTLILEREDPLALAEEFHKFGEVAVVDLDAAWERGNNLSLIKKICRKASCRVGGGIRSLKAAETILSLGAEKIIVGTRAFKGDKIDRVFLKDLISLAGREKIVIAIDCSREKILTHGWRKKTGIKPASVVPELEEFAGEFLLTSVDKEGKMEGPDFGLIEKIRRLTPVRITTAGGITTTEDISRLAASDVNSQLGMTLYTNRLNIEDAFTASVNWSKGLIPTIVQDSASQVLTLAYSSRGSLKNTFQTGKAWYYSRSRKCLWLKGETSGNIQLFRRIRLDCDRDALLLTVEPQGPACHKNRYSCFGPKEFSLQELFNVIAGRIKNPQSNSYTSSLSLSDIEAKVKEETKELLEAANQEEIIWEAADLLYFQLAFLASKGIELSDVLKELERRRKAPKRTKNKRG